MAATVEIVFQGIDRASNVAQRISSAAQGIGRGMQDFGQQLMGIGAGLTAGVTLPITAGLGYAAKQAIDFETAMAEVSKAANLTGEPLEAMGDQILEMTRTIPRSAGELAEIAAAGGRLGIGAESLENFVRLTSEMSVAFDMSADQAGDSAAKIANNFRMMDDAGQIDFDRLETYGNVVNNLADNMATTEANIVNATGRMAGVANTYGMTENEVAALAAGFTALGVAPETAARAFNSTASRLAMATELGGKVQEGLQQLGISAEEMQQAFESGRGTEAYRDFLQTVADAGPEAGSALTKIFGQGFSDEILQAAGGIEQFNNAFNRMAEAEGGGGSTMASSFETMSQTTGAQLQLLRNAFNEMAIEIGSAMLPAINSVVSAIRPMLTGVADFARANPGIARMGVAFAAVAAAIGPVLVGLGAVASFAGTGLAALGGLALPLAAAAAAAVGLAAGLEPVQNFFESTDFSAIGSQLSSAFSSAMMAVSQIDFESVFQRAANGLRTMLSGIGDLLGAIDFSTMAYSLGRTIGNALTGIGRFLSGINWAAAVSGLVTALTTGIGRAIQAIGAFLQGVDFGGLGRALGSIFVQVPSMMQAAFYSVNWGALAVGLGTVLLAVGEGFVEFLSGAIVGVFEGLGTLLMNAIQPAIDLLSNIPGMGDLVGGGEAASPALDMSGAIGADSGLGAMMSSEVSQAGSEATAQAIQMAQGITQPMQQASTQVQAQATQMVTAMQQPMQQMQTQMAAMGPQMAATMNASLMQPMQQVGTQMSTVFSQISTQVSTAMQQIVTQVSQMGSQMSSAMSAAFSQMSAQLSAAMSAMVAQMSQVGAQMSAAIQGVIAAIQGVAAQAGAAGAAIGQEMAAGILSSVGEVQAAAQQLASAARSALPGSDAEVGPLSDLTRTGPALVDTFANGIRPTSTLMGNLNRTMGTVRSALAGDPATVRAVSGIAGQAPVPVRGALGSLTGGAAGGGGGGGGVTVHYAPSINVPAGTSEQQTASFEQQLRDHAEQLAELISEAQERRGFLAFGGGL
ncbi:MAG: phage tail tape measure protein [Cyanobacteria bacterium SBC]|nr:phage tail tape measure protein [Cyanobacteria bacterium SBC]